MTKLVCMVENKLGFDSTNKLNQHVRLNCNESVETTFTNSFTRLIEEIFFVTLPRAKSIKMNI